MAEVTVTVRRPDLEDGDQEELKVFVQPVFAQYYPGDKEENWWVVIGSAQSNKLLSIKKVTNFKAVKEIQVKLNFLVKNESASASNNNELTYQIYLICDSYIGCDQEDTFKVKLA
jgi:pre-mRNA-splicing helicase BRR2